MPAIFYDILFFMVIGAIGMAIANRKAEPAVRRKRWLKYCTYILFTCTVVIGIFYSFFYYLAWVIAGASFLELLKVNFSKPAKPFKEVATSVIIFLMVAAGFLLFARSFQNSFLLFIYFQVLIFDGFCQITGQLFGKRQLAPKISPTKTLEGFMGGWVFCIASAMMTAKWVSLPVFSAVLFGVITGLTCLFGDLLASLYKRKVQVKDYSNWLPGQGGFLDRFDSFLFTAAAYYLLYITIFKNDFEWLSQL